LGNIKIAESQFCSENFAVDSVFGRPDCKLFFSLLPEQLTSTYMPGLEDFADLEQSLHLPHFHAVQ